MIRNYMGFFLLFLVARVKEVGVEVPVVDRKQIHVPVAKAHGGYGTYDNLIIITNKHSLWREDDKLKYSYSKARFLSKRFFSSLQFNLLENKNRYLTYVLYWLNQC